MVQTAIVQAAIEHAAQASAEREMVSRAQAIMDKYSGGREPAENYMGAADREAYRYSKVL